MHRRADPSVIAKRARAARLAPHARPAPLPRAMTASAVPANSPQQHEAYISRLLQLQRKAHRTAEETETAKLLIVLIADYEAKHFTVEKASGGKPSSKVEDIIAPEQLREIFANDQKSPAAPCRSRQQAPPRRRHAGGPRGRADPR